MSISCPAAVCSRVAVGDRVRNEQLIHYRLYSDTAYWSQSKARENNIAAPAALDVAFGYSPLSISHMHVRPSVCLCLPRRSFSAAASLCRLLTSKLRLSVVGSHGPLTASAFPHWDISPITRAFLFTVFVGALMALQSTPS